MNVSRRTVEPLKAGTIVYHHNPTGIKYHLWEGPYYVTGLDDRNNHIIRKVKFGLNVRDQMKQNVKTVSCPLDQLKVARYFKLADFEEWTDVHKIVSHRDVEGIRYYKFRFANTPPIFDQVMSKAELEGNPAVEAYEKVTNELE